MVSESETYEIGKELNDENFESSLVNIVIPKPKEFVELSKRNTNFLRPRYVSVG